MTLVYSPDRPVSQSDLLALYGSVGWSSYTRDPAGLHRAVAGSLWRMGAWDGPELVGLVRAVGDDVSIAYVQDVLVRPDRQRRGIGARLQARAARWPKPGRPTRGPLGVAAGRCQAILIDSRRLRPRGVALPLSA